MAPTGSCSRLKSQEGLHLLEQEGVTMSDSDSDESVGARAARDRFQPGTQEDYQGVLNAMEDYVNERYQRGSEIYLRCMTQFDKLKTPAFRACDAPVPRTGEQVPQPPSVFSLIPGPPSFPLLPLPALLFQQRLWKTDQKSFSKAYDEWSKRRVTVFSSGAACAAPASLQGGCRFDFYAA